MAFVSLRQVLDHAAEHGYGVPAFNVNNLEQIIAIMEAAQETDSPVTPTFRWWCTRTTAPRRRCASNPFAPALPV